jgi:hypothetical protein
MRGKTDMVNSHAKAQSRKGRESAFFAPLRLCVSFLYRHFIFMLSLSYYG